MTTVTLNTEQLTEAQWVSAFAERMAELGSYARGPTINIARVFYALCGHLPPADIADDHARAWTATFSRYH